MTEKERMLAGELYIPASSDELVQEMRRAKEILKVFNHTGSGEGKKRKELLKELLGSIGKGSYIEPPFRCDYGKNTYIGEGFCANYECIILDVCKVTIGDRVLFGPRVSLFAAGHPIDAGVRGRLLEFGSPITIEDDVWIGGNTVINPGVTIGRGTIIGSGSVVEKDIPQGVIAVGNPCRVLREITEEDREFWERKEAEYYAARESGKK